MPKKTRKEKIIAELRRKLETSKITNEVVVEKKEALPERTTDYKPPTTAPTTAPYVLKDLRKTFILATLAISFELVLYLLWQ